MGLLDDVMMSKVTLSPEQLSSIGCVAVESTYCEHFVEHLIWSLCDLEEEKAKFFTDRFQLQARFDLLSDIAKPTISDKQQLLEFTRLISDLKEANTERNTIIHGVWTSTAPMSLADIGRLYPWVTPKPAQAMKRKLRDKPTIFKATDIDETAKKIARLTRQLGEFTVHAWPHLAWR